MSRIGSLACCCKRPITENSTPITSKPSQAPFYKGLQDVHAIARAQGIDPKDTKIRWTINKNNLVETLLAPWNKDEVTRGFENILGSLAKNKSDDVLKDRENNINTTASYAATVALRAMIDGGIRGKGKPNNYYANGNQLTDEEIEQVLQLIKSKTQWLTEYSDNARGIIISSADALFTPAGPFITKDLADPSNSASDQKSSSTLIPPNTPVFIVAQLETTPGLKPQEASTLAIWRPEFGIKFVPSCHVNYVDQEFIDDYCRFQQEGNDCKLKITLTEHVKKAGTFEHLSKGTLLPTHNNDVMMAECSFITSEQDIPTTHPSQLKLYKSKLKSVELESMETSGLLSDHIGDTPLPLNNLNIYNQLANSIHWHAPSLQNRYFAWGEGIIGPNMRGQDISTFIRKFLLPFGHSLPRHSQDQVNEGQEIEGSQTDGTSSEANHKTLVKYGQLGTCLTWGPGSHILCHGNVTMAKLRQLDSAAARDGTTSGGMQESDLVPLVSSSPIALTTKDENGKQDWHNDAFTAVRPVFKKGCHSTFIREDRKLKFHEYIKPLKAQR